MGLTAKQLRGGRPHVAMPKARGVEGKETEGLHQRVDAPVPEAESGSTLLLDNDGLGDGVKVVVADPAVVAQMFDAQETSVGGKADLPQGGQIGESPTDFKVVRIVDRRFGPERLTFLVVLLDPGFFVVDVERRDDSLGEVRVRNGPGVCRVTRRVKMSGI